MVLLHTGANDFLDYTHSFYVLPHVTAVVVLLFKGEARRVPARAPDFHFFLIAGVEHDGLPILTVNAVNHLLAWADIANLTIGTQRGLG